MPGEPEVMSCHRFWVAIAETQLKPILALYGSPASWQKYQLVAWVSWWDRRAKSIPILLLVIATKAYQSSFIKTRLTKTALTHGRL